MKWRKKERRESNNLSNMRKLVVISNVHQEELACKAEEGERRERRSEDVTNERGFVSSIVLQISHAFYAIPFPSHSFSSSLLYSFFSFLSFFFSFFSPFPFFLFFFLPSSYPDRPIFTSQSGAFVATSLPIRKDRDTQDVTEHIL